MVTISLALTPFPYFLAFLPDLREQDNEIKIAATRALTELKENNQKKLIALRSQHNREEEDAKAQYARVCFVLSSFYWFLLPISSSVFFPFLVSSLFSLLSSTIIFLSVGSLPLFFSLLKQGFLRCSFCSFFRSIVLASPCSIVFVFRFVLFVFPEASSC